MPLHAGKKKKIVSVLPQIQLSGFSPSTGFSRCPKSFQKSAPCPCGPLHLLPTSSATSYPPFPRPAARHRPHKSIPQTGRVLSPSQNLSLAGTAQCTCLLVCRLPPLTGRSALGRRGGPASGLRGLWLSLLVFLSVFPLSGSGDRSRFISHLLFQERWLPFRWSV